MRACVLSRVSHAQLFATLWTAAHQDPLSMGFSRQEYCSGLPFPSPVDLSHSGIKPGCPALQADSLPTEPRGNPKTTGGVADPFSRGIDPGIEPGAPALQVDDHLFQHCLLKRLCSIKLPLLLCQLYCVCRLLSHFSHV